jgi:hypothetical protein
MRAGAFIAIIQVRLSEHKAAPYFDARSGVQETRVAVATCDFEVLVKYALTSFELTCQFHRFPRVRQQTRGNFSFEYLEFAMSSRPLPAPPRQRNSEAPRNPIGTRRSNRAPGFYRFRVRPCREPSTIMVRTIGAACPWLDGGDHTHCGIAMVGGEIGCWEGFMSPAKVGALSTRGEREGDNPN